MRVDDLTLEVRDRTLKRVGQITPLYLDLHARTRWCGVGEWTVNLPGDHPMVEHLSTPGSGIVLVGPSGTGDGVILSGPTRMPKRVRNQQNPDGSFTFSGVTDEIVLQGARAFPQPTNANPSTQTVANDTRTGTTEDLLRQFTAYNVMPSHTAPGRVRGLRQYLSLVGVSAGRGLTQTKSPRFQNLLELLQEIIAYDPSLGFRVVQVGGSLQFQVLDARDRSAFVRFDVDNGTLTSEETAQTAPTATDIIVAGQGEGVERMIVRRRDAIAIAQEADWGVPIEEFVDQRDVDNAAELEQKGDERLIETRGGTSAKMVPADDTTMQVGVDWRQGDLVTSIVAGAEPVARITEIAYIASSAGVMAGAALGDVSGFTQSDAESSKVQGLDQRVSNLERASAGPIDASRLPRIVPAGVIEAFAGSAAPSGYLLCQGQAVSRTTYADLYAVVGTTFGAGDGSTTFNVPNLKGRIPVGLDTAQTEFDARGETGGAKTHTLAATEMPSHVHSVDPPSTTTSSDSHSHTVSGTTGTTGLTAILASVSDGASGSNRVKAGNDSTGRYDQILGGSSHNHSFSATTSSDTHTHTVNVAAFNSASAGGGDPHNNLQPYLVLHYIIKT